MARVFAPARRLRIADILIVVAVLAVGLAAMRDGSTAAHSAVLTATLLAVLTAWLAAWVDPRGRPGCCGFALFGGALFLLTAIPTFDEGLGAELPTARLLAGVGSWFHEPPAPPAGLATTPNPYQAALMSSMSPGAPRPQYNTYLALYQQFITRVQNSERIGKLLVCWAVGMLGAVLGRLLGSRRQAQPGTVTD